MATITLPAALCAVLLTGANAGWGLSNTVVRSTNRAADRAAATAARVSARAPHAVVQAGCNNIAFAPNRCRFGPREPDGTVLLAGDSQAWAIADGLIAAGGRRGFDTVVASRNRCPFLGRPSSTTDRAPCVRWQKAVLEWALATRPALVVIANRATGYVQPGKAWVTLERDDGRPARSKEEATMLYRSALEAVVQPLARAGIPVVIVASIPEMKGFTDGTSLLARAVGRQAFAIRRADAVADRQPAFDVEQTLARQTNGITVFDPMDTLCSATSCSTEHDGGPLYQDWTHLSVYGSLSLTDALAGALNSAIDGTAGE